MKTLQISRSELILSQEPIQPSSFYLTSAGLADLTLRCHLAKRGQRHFGLEEGTPVWQKDIGQ